MLPVHVTVGENTLASENGDDEYAKDMVNQKSSSKGSKITAEDHFENDDDDSAVEGDQIDESDLLPQPLCLTVCVCVSESGCLYCHCTASVSTHRYRQKEIK